VNGAQWAAGKVTVDSDTTPYEKLFTVNVLGPFRALHAFLPLSRKRSTKKIINISSTAGSLTLNESLGALGSTHAPYNVSKCGID